MIIERKHLLEIMDIVGTCGFEIRDPVSFEQFLAFNFLGTEIKDQSVLKKIGSRVAYDFNRDKIVKNEPLGTNISNASSSAITQGSLNAIHVGGSKDISGNIAGAIKAAINHIEDPTKHVSFASSEVPVGVRLSEILLDRSTPYQIEKEEWMDACLEVFDHTIYERGVVENMVIGLAFDVSELKLREHEINIAELQKTLKVHKDIGVVLVSPIFLSNEKTPRVFRKIVFILTVDLSEEEKIAKLVMTPKETKKIEKQMKRYSAIKVAYDNANEEVEMKLQYLEGKGDMISSLSERDILNFLHNKHVEKFLDYWVAGTPNIFSSKTLKIPHSEFIKKKVLRDKFHMIMSVSKMARECYPTEFHAGLVDIEETASSEYLMTSEVATIKENIIRETKPKAKKSGLSEVDYCVAKLVADPDREDQENIVADSVLSSLPLHKFEGRAAILGGTMSREELLAFIEGRFREEWMRDLLRNRDILPETIHRDDRASVLSLLTNAMRRVDYLLTLPRGVSSDSSSSVKVKKMEKVKRVPQFELEKHTKYSFAGTNLLGMLMTRGVDHRTTWTTSTVEMKNIYGIDISSAALGAGLSYYMSKLSILVNPDFIQSFTEMVAPTDDILRTKASRIEDKMGSVFKETATNYTNLERKLIDYTEPIQDIYTRQIFDNKERDINFTRQKRIEIEKIRQEGIGLAESLRVDTKVDTRDQDAHTDKFEPKYLSKPVDVLNYVFNADEEVYI